MSNPISCYDPARFDSVSHGGWTRAQSQAGGRKRASTAKRHKYGFFLPDHCDTVPLPDNYVHGRAGGLARAKQRKED